MSSTLKASSPISDKPGDRFGAIVNTKTTTAPTTTPFKKRTHNNNNKDLNSKNLTSMQRFWLEHIVINRKIIPMTKLRPTVGVLPWEESKAPKKFNKWCFNIVNNGFCRFGDKCFNAHPAEGFTCEQLECEAHDISVLEGNTNKNTNNKNVPSASSSSSTKSFHNKSTVISNSNGDRFANLTTAKPASKKYVFESQQHDHDQENNNDNHQVPTGEDDNDNDNMMTMTREASPLLTFDIAKISSNNTTTNTNNNNTNNEDELVRVWRQRGNCVVYYPVSLFNEKSRQNHELGKTVVECYFQAGCKDPSCTFLHMKPNFIHAEKKEVKSENKESTNTTITSTSGNNNNNNNKITSESEIQEILKKINANKQVLRSNNTKRVSFKIEDTTETKPLLRLRG